MHRRTDAVRGRVSAMRHSVMGTDGHGADAAASTLQDAGGKVSAMAGSAPAAAKERTRGAPLAAGLVAFAAGWVVSAALPPSVKERELAATAKDNAVEPIKEQA